MTELISLFGFDVPRPIDAKAVVEDLKLDSLIATWTYALLGFAIASEL
jgi:hypothetical protein